MDPTRPPVRRLRLSPRLALVCAVGLPVVLAGCGQGGYGDSAAASSAASAATSAASSAASAASSAAGGLKTAATEQIRKQLCRQTTGSGALADVRITDTERAAAGRLASAASAAGVADKYVEPLRQVAESKDQQKVSDAITALRNACASQ